MQMTEQQAIELLRKMIRTDTFEESFSEIMQDCALTLAIKALKKQIPKRMENMEQACDLYGDCPECGTSYHFTDHGDFKFCPNCGQKIDWSEQGETP